MATRSLESIADMSRDEDSFTMRMFRCMSAGNALPIGMEMEQAYPILNGFIAASPARRQNMVTRDHLESAGSIGGLLAWAQNLEEGQNVEEDEEHKEKGLTPEQKDGISDLLKRNPKFAEEWSNAPVAQTEAMTSPKPPGLQYDTVGLSAVVLEEYNKSAKVFGMIGPNDGITLAE